MYSLSFFFQSLRLSMRHSTWAASSKTGLVSLALCREMRMTTRKSCQRSLLPQGPLPSHCSLCPLKRKRSVTLWPSAAALQLTAYREASLASTLDRRFRTHWHRTPGSCWFSGRRTAMWSIPGGLHTGAPSLLEVIFLIYHPTPPNPHDVISWWNKMYSTKWISLIHLFFVLGIITHTIDILALFITSERTRYIAY